MIRFLNDRRYCHIGVFGLIFIVHLYLFVLGWHATWDDSAITLAFSKNLVKFGDVIPSEYSDRVEGYSTNLWMLLQALGFMLYGKVSFLIAAAKIQSLVINLANCIFVFILGRKILGGCFLPILATLYFAFSDITIIESINGMENPIYVLTILLSFLLFWSRQSRPYYLIFVLCSSLFILVRWEAAWFLVPFLIVNLATLRSRGWVCPEHVVWAVVFIGFNGLRYAYFGEILTNPIVAKSNFPYSQPGFDLLAHIRPLLQFIYAHLFLGLTCVGLLLVLVKKDRSNFRQLFNNAWQSAICDKRIFLMALILGFCVVFNLVVGKNWGPKSRMFFVALPFFTILMFHVIQRIDIMGLQKPVVIFLVLFSGLFGVKRALSYIENGYIEYGVVTVDQVARIVPAIQEIQDASRQTRLTFAGPDMGGLMLYSNDLRIIDIGLFCNKTLAHEGFSKFNEFVFLEEATDLIECHGHWTETTKLGGNQDLFDYYSVVFSNGIRFFVRNSLLQNIPVNRLRRFEFDKTGRCVHYNQGSYLFKNSVAADFEINRVFGAYYVLACSR